MVVKKKNKKKKLWSWILITAESRMATLADNPTNQLISHLAIN